MLLIFRPFDYSDSSQLLKRKQNCVSHSRYRAAANMIVFKCCYMLPSGHFHSFLTPTRALQSLQLLDPPTRNSVLLVLRSVMRRRYPHHQVSSHPAVANLPLRQRSNRHRDVVPRSNIHNSTREQSVWCLHPLRRSLQTCTGDPLVSSHQGNHIRGFRSMSFP